MKVHVVRRGIKKSLWLHSKNQPKKVAYCGYLEVNDPFKEDLWDWCNWSCWTREKPKECEHLLINHCNSDVAFCINGKWYSHKMDEFKNFDQCYNNLVGSNYNEYFGCLWPITYGFENPNALQIATPSNINSFIK